MIIGKRDKEKLKKLKQENKLLNDEYFKNAYKDDLMNLVKAIINKFGEKQITVSEEEIQRVKNLELYVMDDIMRFAKRYELIDKNKLLHSYKED